MRATTDDASASVGTSTGVEDSKLSGLRHPFEHKLKSWPQFFEPILRGEKAHELRRSDDRDFRAGDILHLQEFDPITSRYTGRELRAKITYITSAKNPCALSENSLHPDYCILSVRKM